MKYISQLWVLIEHTEDLIFWAICMVIWHGVQVSPFILLVIPISYACIRWNGFNRRIKSMQVRYRLYPTKQNLYAIHILKLEYAASIVVSVSMFFSWSVGAWSVQYLTWLYSLILTTLMPILLTPISRYFGDRYVKKLSDEYNKEYPRV